MNSIKNDFTNMNIKDFIDYIITFDDVDDILENCKTQSEKGFIFERLFDIVIKFGFCDVFINNNYKHLIGNSNTGTLKILKNYNKYLNEKFLVVTPVDLILRYKIKKIKHLFLLVLNILNLMKILKNKNQYIIMIFKKLLLLLMINIFIKIIYIYK